MPNVHPLPVRRAVALLAVGLLVSACGDPAAEPSATTSEPSASTSTAPSPSASPSDMTSPASTPSGEGSVAATDLPEPAEDPTESAGFPDPGGQATAYLQQVEIGDHSGYERVVFTLTDDATGVPAWRVEYVDEVRASGSGEPVDVEGAAFLQVTLAGVSGVDLTGDTFEEVYTGPTRIAGASADAGQVTEVVRAGDFEAVMSWAIGVDERRPFRAFTLTDPARLVVDVVTP